MACTFSSYTACGDTLAVQALEHGRDQRRPQPPLAGGGFWRGTGETLFKDRKTGVITRHLLLTLFQSLSIFFFFKANSSLLNFRASF